MIRIGIVEDDALYMEQLKEYLKRYQKENQEDFQVSAFTGSEELLWQYSADYDVILLDIQLGCMNGLECAKQIRRLDRRVILIFVTNSVQYAIQGYSVNALDYMVKPVKYFKFSQVIKRALESIREDDEKYISLHTRSGTVKVLLKDIYYVESRHHDLLYRTKHGEYTVRGRLTDCSEALSPYGFYQVQKSYVVNMKKVEEIRTNSCVVCGTEIMISRAKKKDFMEVILRYMGNTVS